MLFCLSTCVWPRSEHTQTSKSRSIGVEPSEHTQKKDGYDLLVLYQDCSQEICLGSNACCVEPSEHTQKEKVGYVCSLVGCQECDLHKCVGNQLCCENHVHNRLTLPHMSLGLLFNKSIEQAKQHEGNISNIGEIIRHEREQKPIQVYSISLDLEEEDDNMEEIKQERKVASSEPTLYTWSGKPKPVNKELLRLTAALNAMEPPEGMREAMMAWKERLDKKQAERELRQRKEVRRKRLEAQALVEFFNEVSQVQEDRLEVEEEDSPNILSEE